MIAIPNYVAPTGPTDTRSFAERNVHLGAGEYVFAMFAEKADATAARIAAGEELETMNFQVQGQVFTIAGKALKFDMEAARVPEEATPTLAVASAPAATDDVQRSLLGLQEVEIDKEGYDFTKMTRQEIKDAGKELFAAGKITLDELFRFDHPDGKLQVGLDGAFKPLDADEVVDFIASTRKSLSDMEATGEALRADSGYSMMQELMQKLIALG